VASTNLPERRLQASNGYAGVSGHWVYKVPLLPPQSLAHSRAQDPLHRDFSHDAATWLKSRCFLGPAKPPLCSNVRQPGRKKHPPGCQGPVLSKACGVRHPCRRLNLGTPLGTLFVCKNSRCACKVTVRGLSGNFEPKVGPKTRHGAQKVPQKRSKSYFFGLLCVALGRRCEKICTLREPHYLLRFNFILRVLARPFSPSARARECNVHQKLSF
jgi:hypothetical protein